MHASDFPTSTFARNLKDRTDFADEGETFSGWEFLLPLTKPLESTVFDFLGDCIFVIDEPPLIEQTLSTFYEQIQKHFEQTIAVGDVGLEPGELFLDADAIREQIEKRSRVELRSLGKTAAATDEDFRFDSEKKRGRYGWAAVSFSDCREIIGFRDHGSFDAKVSRRCSTVCRRLGERWSKYPARYADAWPCRTIAGHAREYDASVSPESLIVGDLSSGFEIPSADLTIYTETDVFGEAQHAENTRHKAAAADEE